MTDSVFVFVSIQINGKGLKRNVSRKIIESDVGEAKTQVFFFKANGLLVVLFWLRVVSVGRLSRRQNGLHQRHSMQET